jgi:hypothetical protein
VEISFRIASSVPEGFFLFPMADPAAFFHRLSQAFEFTSFLPAQTFFNDGTRLAVLKSMSDA